MGYWKQKMIEENERWYNLPDETLNVCKKHFEDFYLINFIEDNSASGICSYCGEKTKVVKLSHFMEHVIKQIEKYFNYPENEGLPLASGYYDDDKEVIPGVERYGSLVAPSHAEHYDCIEDLLYEIGLIADDDILNEEIKNCFLHDEWIQRDCYVMSMGQELSYRWNIFEEMVKYERRFTFFKTSEFAGDEKSDYYCLMDILTELGNAISSYNLCKEIKEGEEIFRCRFLNEGEVAKSFVEVTSPPKERAKQSRMSPAGVSMFYGAFDEKTAIIESRPIDEDIKKYVVAKFKTMRNLNILDLSSLPLMSFWMPSDYSVVEFLHSFKIKITKPIQRDDCVHFEYVPSQVFTEYLRCIYLPNDKKKIDGIIYNSSLDGANNNIVLFYDQKSSSNVLELVEIC